MTVELDRKVHELLGHCCHELQKGVDIESCTTSTIIGGKTIHDLSVSRSHARKSALDRLDMSFKESTCVALPWTGCVKCGKNIFDSTHPLFFCSVPKYSEDLNLAWPLRNQIPPDFTMVLCMRDVAPDEVARLFCKKFVDGTPRTIGADTKVQEVM